VSEMFVILFEAACLGLTLYAAARDKWLIWPFSLALAIAIPVWWTVTQL
jgi:hypothetical protein